MTLRNEVEVEFAKLKMLIWRELTVVGAATPKLATTDVVVGATRATSKEIVVPNVAEMLEIE